MKGLNDLLLRDQNNLTIYFLLNDFYTNISITAITENILDHDFKLKFFDCFNSLTFIPFSVYQSSHLQELFSRLKIQANSPLKSSEDKYVDEAVKTSLKTYLSDSYTLTNAYSEDNPLELFGLTFYYNIKHERFLLSEKYFDLKELI
jgi:hypothetical protein